MGAEWQCWNASLGRSELVREAVCRLPQHRLTVRSREQVRSYHSVEWQGWNAFPVGAVLARDER